MRRCFFAILFLAKVAFSEELGERHYFYLPPEAKIVSSVDEETYVNLMLNFQKHFSEKVRNEKKLLFFVSPDWRNPYFGAYADAKASYFEIQLWGGMARAPGMTTEILKTVLCHELGHIIGGEPFQTVAGAEWASSEGQSDFFAALVCLPEVLDTVLEPGVEALQRCDGHRLCAQIMQSGLNFVLFLQQYSYRKFKPVSLQESALLNEHTPRNSYPSDQCRLDTFISAALCLKKNYTIACSPPPCLRFSE